jgi:hypothetical protein
LTIDTLWKICVAIFLAGGAFAGYKRMKRDVNGLGRRTRQDKEIEDFRYLTNFVADVVYQDDQEKRRELGKMFLEAWDHEGRR